MIKLRNAYKIFTIILLGLVSFPLSAKYTIPGIFERTKTANITIWVHGTHPLKRLACCRLSPLRKQMYAPIGLSLASNLPGNYHFAQIAHACNEKNAEEYPIEHFYLFGWNSAKVTSKQRRQSGQDLCNEINQLLKTYKKQYSVINLRLIGFSHGGNVILNCINCTSLACSDVKTEVILLATPIQESTRLYANNTNIDRIYSFYSDGDWIQKIDMQKLHADAPRHSPFWSKRTFADTDRVIQIQLKVNGKFIGHLKYRKVMKHLPEMMQNVQNKVGKDKKTEHLFLDFKTR